MGVTCGRVYEPVSPEEGTRVLVDRLWPRGLRKEDPRVGTWCKKVAPSGDLRHDLHAGEPLAAFEQQYRTELEHEPAAAELDKLTELARTGSLHLVSAAATVPAAHVTVLKDIIDHRLSH